MVVVTHNHRRVGEQHLSGTLHGDPGARKELEAASGDIRSD